MLRRDFVKNLVVIGGVAAVAPAMLSTVAPSDQASVWLSNEFKDSWRKSHPVWPNYLHHNQWKEDEYGKSLTIIMITYVRIGEIYHVICREQWELGPQDDLRILSIEEVKCHERLEYAAKFVNKNWKLYENDRYNYKFPEWA